MGFLTWGGAIREFSILGLTSLELVGLILTFLVIVYYVPQYIAMAYTLWLGPLFKKNVNFVKMGQWALITGASEGIGRAFAEELAKRGVNVILMSRTRSKLETVAQDLESKYGVHTKVIPVDFTDVTVYDRIQEEIQGLEIGTLVNNVGMLSVAPDYFLQSETQGGRVFPDDILYCNVFAITKMTQIILPQMVSRKKGVIINVGSLLGTVPTPFLAVYSATKAYIDYFSRSLSSEYESKGIVIQTVLPGFVCTNMINVKKSSFAAPTPGTYVRSALKSVGLEKRTSAHWMHRLAKRGTELTAFFFPTLLEKSNYTLFKSMREVWDQQ